MEKTLNMGAFEALDQQEMMNVDGGCLGFALVCIGIAIVIWLCWPSSVS